MLLMPALHHDLRPPLKWAGGKRWLVPNLTRAWDVHRHRRLGEPVCGGLGGGAGVSTTGKPPWENKPHPV